MDRRKLLAALGLGGAALAVPIVLSRYARQQAAADVGGDDKIASALFDKPAIAASDLVVRRSDERGGRDLGWLQAKHSFSFASYRDTKYDHFRSLVVLNEDRIAAGGGFPMHPHKDMEIITYIISGALQHRDSTGGGSVIHPGEVQKMTAGRGVWHSEFNPARRASASVPASATHLLQIWLRPDVRGLPPSYQQKKLSAADKPGELRLLASKDGRDGVVRVRQDVALYAAQLRPGAALLHDNRAGRHVWLQIVRGRLDVGGKSLSAGDALHTSAAGALSLSAREASEVLLFDLA
ncbi:MAG: pirin family protein [Myxococcales bacterium]|nr:pirin family protein [Myxococcales bacterium]